VPQSLTVRGLAVVVLASCAHPVAPPPAPPPQPPAIPKQIAEPSWVGMRLEPGTVRVAQVIDNAPAARAGVRVGDEVVSLDGGPIATADDFIQRISVAKAGSNVMVGLSRGGERVSLRLQPETRPDPNAVIRQSLADKQAPAFELPVITGGASGKLADHAGHVVVAEFWATWCKPCAITMPRLDQWQSRYAAQGLVVLGISDEEPDEIRRYATDHAIGYTLAHDTGSKVAARYLRMGVPLLVVIDKRGVVRYAGMGAGELDRVETIVEATLRE
jgi:peroxiredoxin